jgi:hypothetical protein
MMSDQRRRQVEEALRDPPQTHPDAPGGVWSTDRWCYDFVADNLPEEARTLETGCGVSTVLLAQWSAEHVCIVPDADEERRTREWLDAHGLSQNGLRFEIGPSDTVLPSLEAGPLDLVLVDGSHGFPAAIIDWYYGCGMLRRGGIAIFDDVNLKPVGLGLARFLDADPRWQRLQSSWKWAAYRRLADGPLREDWLKQPFLGRPRERGRVTRVREAAQRGELRAKLRGRARRALRR